MKKVAIVIYPGYCLFEIITLMEALAMANCKSVVFAEKITPLRSEEGLLIQADYVLEDLDTTEFVGLALSGFQSSTYPIKDDSKLLEIIKAFNQDNKTIGAISIAPLFLLKAGILQGKEFMCGCLKEDLKEEGLSDKELALMKDWEYCVEHYDTLKYLVSDNTVTSVAYGYREWAMAFCKLLNITTYPKSFGLTE